METELIQVNPRLGAMAVMNGDVSFTTSFVSTFRGILQGLPLKVIFIVMKKGSYFLVARPDIRDVQDLKGKKLGVSTLRGTDQLVAEEMLRARGFNPALLQVVALGETSLKAQALASGVIDIISVPPPYDLNLLQLGQRVLAETIQVMTQWLRQSPEVAARSYDLEFKALSKDGQMTDAEMEYLIERLSDKKKSLDEVGDFSLVRQAAKELNLVK